MYNSSMTTALFAVVATLALVECAPWRDELFNRRVCGDQLANMLALVCSGRGYNMPFRPTGHRTRRQIVDECCYRSCTPSMLELYCRPDLGESSTNTQIRKRSENHLESSESNFGEDDTTAQLNPSQPESQNAIDNNPLPQKSSSREQDEITLFPLHQLPHKEKLRAPVSSTEQKPVLHSGKDVRYHRRRSFPPLRHHRNLPRSSRQLGHQTKRTKNDMGGSKEASNSFQIGTVKPYFAGRVMVSHRSNNILHGP